MMTVIVAASIIVVFIGFIVIKAIFVFSDFVNFAVTIDSSLQYHYC